MAQRLSWWVIPGALVVLCRVATLNGEPAPQVAEPVEATVLPDRVAVREASGRRHAAFPLAAFARNAFVVVVPPELAGRKVTMTIWRRLAGGREATPWLTLEPRVRADATLPIAGLAAGRYDLVVT